MWIIKGLLALYIRYFAVPFVIILVLAVLINLVLSPFGKVLDEDTFITWTYFVLIILVASHHRASYLERQSTRRWERK